MKFAIIAALALTAGLVGCEKKPADPIVVEPVVVTPAPTTVVVEPAPVVVVPPAPAASEASK